MAGNQILPITGKESAYRRMDQRKKWIRHNSRAHAIHIGNLPEVLGTDEQKTLD